LNRKDLQDLEEKQTLWGLRDLRGSILRETIWMSDLVLSEENVVQPDILLVRKERTDIIGEANITAAPDLVIEILSAGSRCKDLELKRKTYAQFGIQEYWVIDPDAETAEVLVWSKLGYVTAATYAKSLSLSSPLLPDLNLPLSEIFAETA